MPSTSDQSRKPIIIWEDLHPHTRNNIAVLIVAAGVWVILYGLTFLAPRIMNLHRVFQFALIERLWVITSIVLIAVMVFNAVRVAMRYRERLISLTSVVLAVIVIAPVIFFTLYLPSFFNAASSYALGEPYGKIFNQFSNYCDEWEASYGQQANIAIRPQDLDLGLFDKHDVEVYRERKVVFFNFGDEGQVFGLACVLGGGVPHTDGKASDFQYQHIENNYYQFVEHPKS